MDLLTDNPWRIAILKPIEKDFDIDDDPTWIELDGEMVKLGSLEHESLNIPQAQQKALTLLSTKRFEDHGSSFKDFATFGKSYRVITWFGVII